MMELLFTLGKKSERSGGSPDPYGGIDRFADLYEAHTLSDHRLILKVLTQGDAVQFHALYRYARQDAVGQHEDAGQFAQRIAAKCEMIWTIRLAQQPETIIGDCALHDWDASAREFAFGGSLLPEYQGQQVMGDAFSLVAAFARAGYGARSMICYTSPVNLRAIRFAEKQGFIRCHSTVDSVVLRKALA